MVFHKLMQIMAVVLELHFGASLARMWRDFFRFFAAKHGALTILTDFWTFFVCMMLVVTTQSLQILLFWVNVFNQAFGGTPVFFF